MDVVPVAEARSGLSRTLRRFRADPDSAPVVIGSHRRPEAVIVPYATYERGASGHETVTLSRLHQLGTVIGTLAAASHLADVRVYGSVSRGDQSPDSDVDLIVTPLADATLFDIAQFEMNLEALLAAPVSVVSSRSLDPERDAHVLAESVAL